MWEYVNKFASGSNLKAKAADLWAVLKQWYKDTNCQNRVQKLTLEMVRQDAKSPKFRGKGAETRSVVPFAFYLAGRMHETAGSVHTQTVKACTSAVLEFYVLLGRSTWDAEAGKTASRKVCLLYKALHDEANSDRYWRLKPNMHLFQELAEYTAPELGNPRHFWAYQDEDFVGWLAKLARTREGPKQAHTVARAVFDRYRALAPKRPGVPKKRVAPA